MALRAQAGRCIASHSSQKVISIVRSSAARHCVASRSRDSTVAVRALFSWPFGNKEEKKGKFDDVLKTARTMKRGTELAPKEAPEGLKLATFAGGCFWGIELAYQRVPGVVKTTVGYTGGQVANPTYEEVCSGRTGHTEVVQCTYDPSQVAYEQLLDVFFGRVDPTTLNRQGNDRGTQYRSGIFYHDDEQKRIAEERVALVNQQLAAGQLGKGWGGSKVVATVEPAGDYYLAEAYHQQYLAKGGRFGMAQSAAKGCNDPIRCYG